MLMNDKVCVLNDAFNDTGRINENRYMACEISSTSGTRPINGEIMRANGQANLHLVIKQLVVSEIRGR